MADDGATQLEPFPSCGMIIGKHTIIITESPTNTQSPTSALVVIAPTHTHRANTTSLGAHRQTHSPAKHREYTAPMLVAGDTYTPPTLRGSKNC